MKRKIYKLLSGAKQGLFALALTVYCGTAYSQTFSYTGSMQTVFLPAGNYSIECWGADGGNATNTAAPMSGGKGGYSKGVFTNASATTYNIYVGGHGGNTSLANTGGGGGGMSDIAAASNTNIVIIAAGGGGGATSGSASEASTGGEGGGLTGGTAIDGTGVSTGTVASGGTQTYGGIALAGSYGAGFQGGLGYGGGGANGGLSGFMHGAGGAGGNGGNGGWNGGGGGCTTTGGNDHAAGGGAGYYGGGGGRGDGGAGGGGSGYIGGVSSGSTISFGQTGFVSNPDVTGNGRVIITALCNISLSVTGVNANNGLCAGGQVVITTNAVSNYSWTTGSTAAALIVSPSTSTVYGLTATSPSNCTSSAQVSITVYPVPVLNITTSNPVVCLGNSAVLTVSGADTYSWNTNSTANSVTVTPAQSTIYNVTGINLLNNCSSVQTILVNVFTPSVTINGNNTICAGGMATLTANAPGAISYTWSTGIPIPVQTIFVSPPSTTIYIATALVSASNIACIGVNTIQVSVIANPIIVPTPNKSIMCVNESVVVSATGGTAYAWSCGLQTSNAPAFTITPTLLSNLVINVTGTGANGCTSTNSLMVIVNVCAGVNEANLSTKTIHIYPNPSQGDVNVTFGSAAELLLISETGQLIRQLSLSEENGYKATLSGLSNGLYFITGQSGSMSIKEKIVIAR